MKYHDNLNCSTRRGFLEREYCTGTKLSKGKRLFILKFHSLLNFFDSLRSSLEDWLFPWIIVWLAALVLRGSVSVWLKVPAKSRVLKHWRIFIIAINIVSTPPPSPGTSYCLASTPSTCMVPPSSIESDIYVFIIVTLKTPFSHPSNLILSESESRSFHTQ